MSKTDLKLTPEQKIELLGEVVRILTIKVAALEREVQQLRASLAHS
jgi:hypothetical protein